MTLTENEKNVIRLYYFNISIRSLAKHLHRSNRTISAFIKGVLLKKKKIKEIKEILKD